MTLRGGGGGGGGSLAEPDPLPNLSTREERVWSSDIERLVLASPVNGGC